MPFERVGRVLLVFPPTRYTNFDNFVIAPQGLMSLAAFVRERYDVRILDATASGYRRLRRVDSKQIEYGLSIDQVMRVIDGHGPNVIGYSCCFSHQMAFIRTISNRVRRKWPDVVQVCGGNYPSFYPDRAFRGSSLNALVIGEGEETFRELLDALDHGSDGHEIDGTAWAQDGDLVRINPRRPLISDISRLPWPAYDLLNMKTYFRARRSHGIVGMGRRTIQVITSRGCPYKCTYCSSTQFWGRGIRFREASDVVDQITFLRERYGVDWIQFEDDNITVKRSHIESLCEEMIRRGLRIKWSVPNGVAISSLDRSLLELMYRAGCRELVLAIESGNEETLRRIKKPLRREQVLPVIRDMQEIGIGVRAYFIVGFPWETRQHLKDTFDLIHQVPWAAVFRATPLPGTPLTEDMIKEGIIDEDYDFENDSFFMDKIRYRGFSNKELSAMIKTVFRRDMLVNPIRLFSKIPVFGWMFFVLIPMMYLRALRRKIADWMGKETD